MSFLDDPNGTGLPQGIPYSFGVGNHDQGPAGDGSPDDTAGFNQYFGTSRYAGKSYYGGHYGSDNDNHYMLFSASGMDFILINIAYMDPQYDGTELNSVLAWANGLMQTYSSRRAIVVSHYMLNNGFNASWSGQGQVMYNALKGNPNLFLMLAGHLTPPEGQRTDVSGGKPRVHVPIGLSGVRFRRRRLAENPEFHAGHKPNPRPDLFPLDQSIRKHVRRKFHGQL